MVAQLANGRVTDVADIDEIEAEARADYALVAALFGFSALRHIVPSRDVARRASTAPGTSRTLGASLRSLDVRLAGASVEQRFAAILVAPRDALPVRLRHAVGLLSAHGISVDWTQFLLDLRAWSADDRRTQSAWARAFWRRDTLPGDHAGVAYVGVSDEPASGDTSGSRNL
jgi:CRISPR type I-E-associated protein CasB/Cse2